MMVRIGRRRGQPLLVLVMVVLCWVGGRAALWQVERGHASTVPPGTALSAAADTSVVVRAPASSAEFRGGKVLPQWAAAVGRAQPRLKVATGVAHQVPLSARLAPSSGEALAAPGPGSASSPEMLWRTTPGPVSPLSATGAAGSSPHPGLAALPATGGASSERRWSADAWALVRSGGGVVSAGPSVATYGASQVGAVLRYRLVRGNPHRATTYLRVSAALNGSGEREAALGLSARPIAGLPVIIAGEGRVSRLSQRTVVRPAVMAVTELPPIALPEGARAEFYLQGGYVGGTGATPFIDGQLRVDRRIHQGGPVEIRAGAGVWGGAQEGAGRLDLGPGATVAFAQGPVSARVALDWRFRLKGSAEPASGPTLTVSAGF